MSGCHFCFFFLNESFLFTVIYLLLVFCRHKNFLFSTILPLFFAIVFFTVSIEIIWYLHDGNSSTYLGPLATLSSSLMAASIVILSIHLTYQKNRKLHQEKTTADLNIKCFVDLSSIDQRRKFLDTTDDNSIEDLKSTFDTERSKRNKKQRDDVHNITNMLNTWELISVSIDHEIVDENMLKNLLRARLVRDWKHMYPLIVHMRQKEPEAYVSAEKIFKKWSD